MATTNNTNANAWHISQRATDTPDDPGSELRAVISDSKNMPRLVCMLRGTAQADNEFAQQVCDALNAAESRLAQQSAEAPDAERVLFVGESDFTIFIPRVRPEYCDNVVAEIPQGLDESDNVAHIANARRLAACWNACIGLHMETLQHFEPGALASMFARSLVSPAVTAADKSNRSITLETFRANLRQAIRNRETVSIGGGEFNHVELDILREHLELSAVANVGASRDAHNASPLLAVTLTDAMEALRPLVREVERVGLNRGGIANGATLAANGSRLLALYDQAITQNKNRERLAVVRPGPLVGESRAADDITASGLCTDSQDVDEVLNALQPYELTAQGLTRSEVTGALITHGADTIYREVWLTTSSRPYLRDASFVCVRDLGERTDA